MLSFNLLEFLISIFYVLTLYTPILLLLIKYCSVYSCNTFTMIECRRPGMMTRYMSIGVGTAQDLYHILYLPIYNNNV